MFLLVTIYLNDSNHKFQVTKFNKELNFLDKLNVRACFNTFLLAAFVSIFWTIDISAQIQNTSKDTIILTKETNDGTVKIELNSLDDLSNPRIDSLIKVLNSKTSVDSSEVYGHSLFKNKFQLIDGSNGKNISKVSDDYIVGFGDEISVLIYGASAYTAKYIVDAEGFIYPEDMPNLFLLGLKLKDARKIIRKTFSRYYIFDKNQITISLSSPREILVNIFGEVKKPGSYSISALNTSFQALYNAGGPKTTGSVRNIKVLNDDKVSYFDVYDLMINPSNNLDLYLSENALINVPVAQKIVRIQGQVNRPMYYELKKNEGLLSLLEFAGGTTSKAYLKNITIERYLDDTRKIIDVNLREILGQNKDFKLYNGDLIYIQEIPASLENFVMIKGAIKRPGRYNLSSTPTIRELLERAQLLNSAKKDLIFLTRLNNDGTKSLVTLNLKEANVLKYKLMNADVLEIKDLSAYVDQSKVYTTGAVRNPIEFPYDVEEQFTVIKAIELSGGLQSDAGDLAYLFRTSINNKNEKEYIVVDLKDAFAHPNDPSKNIIFKPEDELIVLSNTASSEQKFVNIRGAVRNPNEFEYARNLKIKDLILMSGGLRPEASYEIDIFRMQLINKAYQSVKVATLNVDSDFELVGNNTFKIEPGDELVARTYKEFGEQAFITIKGEVALKGDFALIKKNERLLDLIQRAGGFTNQAFIEGVSVLRSDNVVVYAELNSPNGNPILMEGDIINIPKREDLVFILLKNTKALELFPERFDSIKIGVKYHEGKSANWYINEYVGGLGYQSSPMDIFVQSPNGAIKRTKKKFLGLKKVYPGVDIGSVVGVGTDYSKQDVDNQNIMSASQFPTFKEGVIINIDKDGKIEKRVNGTDEDEKLRILDNEPKKEIFRQSSSKGSKTKSSEPVRKQSTKNNRS